MERDEDTNVSIPRGGPIFNPSLTSSLTRIYDFECAILHELEDLEAELHLDMPFNADEEDISVDELKVFTDEELISKAMEEAFKEETHSTQPEESSTTTKETYLEKVEELAKIRQRQREASAASQLHSLKDINKRKNCVAISSESSQSIKSLESLRCSTNAKPSITSEHVEIRKPEVVLCIEVYSNKNSAQKTQEILVLGKQKFTELKDAIHCLTDVIMTKANQHDPSGYFLIEDVFCNDTRDPFAIDYSKPILDWLVSSKEEALTKWEFIKYGETKRNRLKSAVGNKMKPNVPHFRAFEMQNTRFCDLQFCVGATYLYCHQGDCKHRIVIRDMRLMHPEDCENRAAYPLVVYQKKFCVQKCSVCKVYKSVFIRVDDSLVGENPCYLCNKCQDVLGNDGTNRGLQYDHIQEL